MRPLNVWKACSQEIISVSENVSRSRLRSRLRARLPAPRRYLRYSR